MKRTGGWVLGGVAAAVLAGGCARTQREVVVVQVTAEAPTVKFGQFARAEVAPLRLSPKLDPQFAQHKAVVKLTQIVADRLPAAFPPAAGDRVLAVEPTIEEIRFIGGAARFWVGAAPGSSHVRLRIEFKDKATGQAVASPEFYRQSDAAGGAWTVGASDNVMLDHVVGDAIRYVERNR
jgi:hypothetical protein